MRLPLTDNPSEGRPRNLIAGRLWLWPVIRGVLAIVFGAFAILFGAFWIAVGLAAAARHPLT